MYCLTLSCLAQNNYKHYTASDGLPHDVTYNIIQDSKGYIWIGTDDGLAKFEGNDFTVFSLKNGLTTNYVMDIEELTNDTYAIATWGGGLHFFDKDSIFKKPVYKDANLKLYDLKYYNNAIYTYTGSGLTVYDLINETYTTKIYTNERDKFIDELTPGIAVQKLKPIVINEQVYVHSQRPSNNTFKGLQHFNANFEMVKAFSFLSDYNISSVLQLDSDQYVFGIDDALVFTNRDSVLYQLKLENLQSQEDIVKILKAPEKEGIFILMIRSENGEKRLISVNVKNSESFGIEDILPIKAPVSDVMFDFEGNLWIATYGNGLYCYYYTNPKIKNILEGNYIVDIIKHKDLVYVLTESQLYKFNGTSILNTYAINGVAKHLSINKDELTVSVLDQANNKDLKIKIESGFFYNEIRSGKIRQNDTIFVNDKPILTTNEVFIKSVIENDNSIDFYTNKGKWVYDFDDNTFAKDSIFGLRLPSQRINDIIEVDGITYFATDKGLAIQKRDSMKIFNENNGLQNERVNCVFVIDDSVYLGTQSGLSLIEDDLVLNFSKSFGFLSLAINKIIRFDDTLWLAGNNGISIINIDDIKETSPPKLNIKQKLTKFEFDVISFRDRNAINLQYQLNENEWINLNINESEVDFKNFAPNTYRIKFRTHNSHSKWEYSDVFNFEIKPPWYKVWWILALGFLGVSLVIGLVFMKRLKVASKRNRILKNEIAKRILAESELGEVRDNIARDFHDDLGNKLASISLLSDVLYNKVKTEESKVVMTIKNDADYLYKGTKDFIFSLQEKSNYLDELRMYLTDFAEDYLYQFGVDLEVENHIKNNIKLPYYWSKQIIFIFKEAITNIVKHSGANLVKLTFGFDNNQLQIQLNDDGKGFKSSEITSNGLMNMKTRAQRIDCKLKIISFLDNGTTIIFLGQLPLKGSF